MKLLVDAHVFDDYSQGSKTYLKGLYSSALKRKPEWEFFFSAFDTDNLRHELGDRSNLFAKKLTAHNKFLRLGWEFPRLIRQNHFDLAHFQYISPLIKTGKEILTIHDLLFLDFPEYFPLDYRILKNFLFKRSAKRAELVLTVSEYSKAAIMKHYQVPENKIAITPNGVLDFFFDDQVTLPDITKKYGVDQYILYVSRIEPRKNHLGLLKAFRELNLWQQGVKLVFIGGVGIVSKEFTSYYSSLDEKVKQKVLFLQDITLPELKAFYKRSLLCIYPSYAEGFGIPPLEAIACGANTICSSTTAMKEFDFLGDRFFDPHNDNELRNKMMYYLIHPDESGTVSAKEIILKKYTWDASADILIDQIAKLS